VLATPDVFEIGTCLRIYGKAFIWSHGLIQTKSTGLCSAEPQFLLPDLIRIMSPEHKAPPVAKFGWTWGPPCQAHHCLHTWRGDSTVCTIPFECAGTGYFVIDCDAFTRDWYKSSQSRELGPAVSYPEDPLDIFRKSRSRSKATLGPPSPRTDDIARFNEARLGKPSNVLAADTLRQFLVRLPRGPCTTS
jgi:hypothetical protein